MFISQMCDILEILERCRLIIKLKIAMTPEISSMSTGVCSNITRGIAN